MTKYITESDRLFLREIRYGDEDAFEAIFCDPDVMRFSKGVKNRDYLKFFVREAQEDFYPRWGFGLWAVCTRTDGRIIGYCGFTQDTHRCPNGEMELAYRFAKTAWGKRYATEAAEIAIQHAFSTYNAPAILAYIDPENIASIRTAERLGMTSAGQTRCTQSRDIELVFFLPNTSEGTPYP